MKCKTCGQEIQEVKAGDFIEIGGALCLVMEGNRWKHKYCKGDLVVALLKYPDGMDWMGMADTSQIHFEEGKYKIIPRDEALERLK